MSNIEKTQSKDLAVNKPAQNLAKIDFADGSVPENIKPSSIDMIGQSWDTTEAKQGDTKILAFHRVENKPLVIEGEIMHKDVAYFVEVVDAEKGVFKTVSVTATRLVSFAKDSMQAGALYQVTFRGLKTNKTNNRKSARFEVRPFFTQK